MPKLNLVGPVIVVGAGLFGCMIARALRAKGKDVILLDSREWGAGSPPAGCLLKPSWLQSSMSREQVREAYGVLDNLYGIQKLEFEVTTLVKTSRWKMDWVDPGPILSEPSQQARVMGAGVKGDGRVVLEDFTEIVGSSVVLAGGIWCPYLIEDKLRPASPRVEPAWGVSFKFPPRHDAGEVGNQIRFINPFRQAIVFGWPGHQHWYGDGTKLSGPDDQEKIDHSAERAWNMFGLEGGEPQVGARPLTPDISPVLPVEITPQLHVSTGGGKIGVALAALHASRLAERL